MKSQFQPDFTENFFTRATLGSSCLRGFMTPLFKLVSVNFHPTLDVLIWFRLLYRRSGVLRRNGAVLTTFLPTGVKKGTTWMAKNEHNLLFKDFLHSKLL